MEDLRIDQQLTCVAVLTEVARSITTDHPKVALSIRNNIGVTAKALRIYRQFRPNLYTISVKHLALYRSTTAVPDHHKVTIRRTRNALFRLKTRSQRVHQKIRRYRLKPRRIDTAINTARTTVSTGSVRPDKHKFVIRHCGHSRINFPTSRVGNIKHGCPRAKKHSGRDRQITDVTNTITI